MHQTNLSTYPYLFTRPLSAKFSSVWKILRKNIKDNFRENPFSADEFPICAVLRPAELGLDTLARQAFRLLSKGRTARLLPGFGFHKSKTFEVNAWHILKPSILLTFCPGY